MKRTTHLKLESLIRRLIQEEDSLNKRVKIQYIPVDKKVYMTYDRGIRFEVIINGIKATGHWRPIFGDIRNGVDVNELQTHNENRFHRNTLRIFDNGGSHKRFEISADLKELQKQPKDLRFTGPYLSIDNLKPTFVNKIREAIINPNSGAKLSKQFLQYFNLE